MQAVKATYHAGQVTLVEPAPGGEEGPVEVLVVFPETTEDPWQPILADPRPRPALEQWVREVEEEIAQGKAEPLELNKL